MGLLINEGTYWSAIPLGVNKDGAAIEVRYFASMGMHVEWAGSTAVDATIKLQYSFDLASWYQITGMSVTLAAATGFTLFELTRDKLNFPYVRAVLAKNSETTGTANIRYLMKGI